MFTRNFEEGDILKPGKENPMIFQAGAELSGDLLKVIRHLKETDRGALKVIDENREFLGELDKLLKHNHEYFRHSMEIVSLFSMIREELEKKMDITNHEAVVISSAALLHDIGKIKISNEILEKNGKLGIAEEEEIRKHVQYGYEIVKDQNPEAACVLAYHHMFKKEKPYFYEEDGMFCKDSRGKYIKMGKILAIIDVFHALLYNRDYKKEIPLEQCAAEINKELELSEEDKEVVNLLVEAESRRRGKVRSIKTAE